MSPQVRELILPGVLLIVAGAFATLVTRHAERRIAEARQVVISAEQAAGLAAQTALRQTLAAAAARAQADSAQAVANRAVKRAVALESDLARLEERFAVAAAEAPDTCAIVAQSARNALQTANALTDKWKGAFESERAANGLLRVAYDSLATAKDGVDRALAELRAASLRLVDATKPSLFRQLLPDLYVGVMTGVDITGRPTAVIGVGAGWRL